MATAETRVHDALDNMRSAAQGLHQSISNAAAKRGGALKSDLEDISKKTKTVMDSIKSSMTGENEVAKGHLSEAIRHLEAAQKHASDGLKSSGRAFDASVKHTLSDARTTAQKLSEAVAAKRSALSKKQKH